MSTPRNLPLSSKLLGEDFYPIKRKTRWELTILQRKKVPAMKFSGIRAEVDRKGGGAFLERKGKYVTGTCGGRKKQEIERKKDSLLEGAGFQTKSSKRRRE